MSVTLKDIVNKERQEFNKILRDIIFLGRPKVKYFEIWILFLVFPIGIGLYFYTQQIYYGLGITGMRDIVSWGLYISLFVFFIAVSLIGSLTSSILELLKIRWVSPIKRLGEIVAIGSLIGAILLIIVDMGRPERLFNILTYGRLQSPIIWDVIVINTYLIISILLFYVPLIPDLHIKRLYFSKKSKIKQYMYDFITMAWQGTPEQVIILNKIIRILMIIVIPVAISIHTVTAWLFATTLRPGWDSTNFGPYFVSGAFVAGASFLIVLLYIVRKTFHLFEYINEQHFDMMGKLLVLLMLIYLYFNINEYLIPFYKLRTHEKLFLYKLFVGEFALMFWLSQIAGLIIPTILLIFKYFRKPLVLSVISMVVLLASVLKRILVVIPTLVTPYLPPQNYPDFYKKYTPTLPEIFICLGCFSVALLIMTILIKTFPVLSVYEVAKEKGISDAVIYNKNEV